MTDPGVRVDSDGPVATVTLCRPHVLNAQTPATWKRLREIGRQLPGDIRIVVVRGEGRAFSAGLDLAAMSGPGSAAGPRSGDPTGSDDLAGSGDPVSPPEDPDSGDSLSFATLAGLDRAAAEDIIAGFQEGFSWLRRPDLITVAAVQGHAIGAGFQLALACDLRLLADNAQFTMAEVPLGLVPDLGGTKRLVELVGYGRALEICVTGRRVGAEEAVRTGLAMLAVPLNDLDLAVEELVARVLTAPRDAVVEVKALLAGAADRSFAAQEAAERAAQLRRIADLTGQGE